MCHRCDHFCNRARIAGWMDSSHVFTKWSCSSVPYCSRVPFNMDTVQICHHPYLSQVASSWPGSDPGCTLPLSRSPEIRMSKSTIENSTVGVIFGQKRHEMIFTRRVSGASVSDGTVALLLGFTATGLFGIPCWKLNTFCLESGLNPHCLHWKRWDGSCWWLKQQCILHFAPYSNVLLRYDLGKTHRWEKQLCAFLR